MQRGGDLYLGILGFGVIELQVRVWQAEGEQPRFQCCEGEILVVHPGYPLRAVGLHQTCGAMTWTPSQSLCTTHVAGSMLQAWK